MLQYFYLRPTTQALMRMAQTPWLSHHRVFQRQRPCEAMANSQVPSLQAKRSVDLPSRQLLPLILTSVQTEESHLSARLRLYG